MGTRDGNRWIIGNAIDKMLSSRDYDSLPQTISSSSPRAVFFCDKRTRRRFSRKTLRVKYILLFEALNTYDNVRIIYHENTFRPANRARNSNSNALS